MWHETVERVVNGCFNMQKEHYNLNGLRWNEDYKMDQATKMYDKIFNMKFLPPGRGLWAMGTPLTDSKKLYSALNNCAFVSTDVNTPEELVDVFKFLLDSSMLGIGTGFDTKGKYKNFKIYQPTD